MLLIMVRGIASPLADNAANKGLKELLRTAEVKQERERVVVTATLDRSLFSGSPESPNPPVESTSVPGTSK